MTLEVDPSISVILLDIMSFQEQHREAWPTASSNITAILLKFIMKPQRISMKHLSFLETPFSRKKHSAEKFLTSSSLSFLSIICT